MKFTIAKRLIAVSVCTVALAGGLAAQQRADPPIAGEATLGVAVAEDAVVATGWRASKLLRAEVYNDQNQKIGKIDDFVVSPDGSLSVAVVDVGGFLGMGAHRVAIPVKQFGQVAPKIVLKGASKEALKALPEFRYLT